MEIERKYLVARKPDGLDDYPRIEIEQGYLCTSPTLRIRRMGDSYILTVKEKVRMTSDAIVNREEEFEMSASKYEHLKAKCDGKLVCKTRYRVDLRRSEVDGMYENLVAEVDVFHGKHEGLMLVEVEFPTMEAADAFIPPAWFGEDVSSNPMYRNSFLALNV